MQPLDPVQIIQNVVIFFPAFLIALVAHEFAHAWMALRFGDQTSLWSGRLTLNPLAHMDLFGTVLFPLISIVFGSHIFFGWAKPVPINPSQFSHYRKGLFWVSSAGILMNLFLGMASAFLFVAVALFLPESFGFKAGMVEMLKSLLLINFSLAVFNLIPIPPLDGSNIVLSFLSYNASRKFLEIQQIASYLLLFLMFTGALSIIGIPVQRLSEFAINLSTAVFALALPARFG
jgi:Zn-dependent protease